jgi:hypothetical protein
MMVSGIWFLEEVWSLLRILLSPASLWNEHSSTIEESFVMSKLTSKGVDPRIDH